MNIIEELPKNHKIYNARSDTIPNYFVFDNNLAKKYATLENCELCEYILKESVRVVNISNIDFIHDLFYRIILEKWNVDRVSDVYKLMKILKVINSDNDIYAYFKRYNVVLNDISNLSEHSEMFSMFLSNKIIIKKGHGYISRNIACPDLFKLLYEIYYDDHIHGFMSQFSRSGENQNIPFYREIFIIKPKLVVTLRPQPVF
jgi:hypothetical protein